jgi:four helix bundle protein
MRDNKSGPSIIKSKAFAVKILSLCEKLDSKKRFHLSKQLFRSGTSIGANIYESQNSESLLDFIHKMKIAAKEASETKFWLYLCEQCYGDVYEESLKEDCEELLRILGKIIATSKTKLNNQR